MMRLLALSLTMPVILLFGGTYLSQLYDKATHKPPGCFDDWRLCADASDFINNGNPTHAQASCKVEINGRARYGDPQWSSWSTFSTYLTGPLTAGRITLIDRDVQLQNGYGAWTHNEAHCIYDLNADKVVDAWVVPTR